MKSAAQEDTATHFLERLLALSEKRPDRTRPASAAPNYDELPTAEGVKRFRERLLAAERVGAIVLRHGKRERRHLIERATVKDAGASRLSLGSQTRIVACGSGPVGATADCSPRRAVGCFPAGRHHSPLGESGTRIPASALGNRPHG